MTRNLFEPQGPAEAGNAPPPFGRRIAWFAGLALLSLVIVAATAYLLRALLFIG
ncbi:hypothetical protein [Henriciella litoralis]|uniref:hypothetical protein n=1 Tax=Henriciella litoralis TaxID=568102 RepID=UPI00146EB0B7|nr:hypothetical protein [Henriciella litoralis]